MLSNRKKGETVVRELLGQLAAMTAEMERRASSDPADAELQVVLERTRAAERSLDGAVERVRAAVAELHAAKQAIEKEFLDCRETCHRGRAFVFARCGSDAEELGAFGIRPRVRGGRVRPEGMTADRVDEPLID